MNTRQVATEYRLAHWAQVMQNRMHAGQSIQAFCAGEGISKNTYFYWQRKLREAACIELAKQADGAENALVPNGWTRLERPVSTGMQHAGTTTAAITVEVGGCHISVANNADMTLLAEVCRTLKAL